MNKFDRINWLILSLNFFKLWSISPDSNIYSLWLFAIFVSNLKKAYSIFSCLINTHVSNDQIYVPCVSIFPLTYRANKEAHVYNLLLHLTAGWEGGQLISLWVIHHFWFNPDLDILSSNNPWPFALTCKGEETIPYTPHSDFSIVNGDSCSHS